MEGLFNEENLELAEEPEATTNLFIKYLQAVEREIQHVGRPRFRVGDILNLDLENLRLF